MYKRHIWTYSSFNTKLKAWYQLMNNETIDAICFCQKIELLPSNIFTVNMMQLSVALLWLPLLWVVSMFKRIILFLTTDDMHLLWWFFLTTEGTFFLLLLIIAAVSISRKWVWNMNLYLSSYNYIHNLHTQKSVKCKEERQFKNTKPILFVYAAMLMTQIFCGEILLPGLVCEPGML